jgi:hypothetical protein
VFRCRNRAARKPDPAARKNRAKRFAFGLPQDLHMQLMFEPCVERGSRLSALRGGGFHVERGAAGSARRPRTRRKRLKERPNFPGRTAGCSRHTAQVLPSTCFSATNDALQAVKCRRLPSVRRNVPKVRRKTWRRASSEMLASTNMRVKRLREQTNSFAS